MYIVGDLKYNEDGCSSNQPTPLNFMNSEQFSQLVISESALACMMNQIAKSKIGKLDLNEQRFNDLFLTQGIKLDSQSIYEHLPIFQNKLGQDANPVPLKIEISYSNIEVLLG
jgi:short subunit fatty acids transporter